MLAYARGTRTPKRDQVIVLLSVKAGLRACEIAALEWPMVLDANGTVGDLIEIRTAIAKHQSGRRIPMHPQLKEALTRLLREQRSADSGDRVDPWRAHARQEHCQLVCRDVRGTDA
jgi:integrase/recombinase XerD